MFLKHLKQKSYSGLSQSFLLLLLSLTLIFCEVRAQSYSVYELSSEFIKAGRPVVFDPEENISIASKETISEISKSIFVNMTFNLVVVNYVDSLDPETYEYVNFDYWVEYFAQNSFSTPSDLNNNMLAFYSLNDRVYRIRTGEDIMNRYDDYTLLKIADDITGLLKDRNYDSAFIKLLENLRDYDSFTKLSTGTIVVISIVSAFVSFSLFSIFYKVFKNCRESKLKTILKKFNTMKKSNKPFNLFIESTCVICLEDIHPSDRPELYDGTKIKNATINQSEATKLNVPKNQIISTSAVPQDQKINEVNGTDDQINESLPNQTQNPPELISDVPISQPNKQTDIRETEKSVFLPCGHNFHKSCIVENLKITKKCPICRNEVTVNDFSTLEKPWLDYQAYRYRRYFSTNEVYHIYNRVDNPIAYTRYQGNSNNNDNNYGESHVTQMDVGGFTSGGAGGSW